jgi:hypothetical protein
VHRQGAVWRVVQVGPERVCYWVGLIGPVWLGGSEKGWYSVVKTKCKSLFLIEEGLLSFPQGLQ